MKIFKQICFGLILIPAIAQNSFSQTKSLIDYFLPMPIQKPLLSKGIWGAPNVFPRDTANGLEDTTLKNYCYWDGKIVKDDIGKYHMYASRWEQIYPHSIGWKEKSKAIHAVSDSPMGPFKDTGLITPFYLAGKAHNVVGLRTKEGKYAVIGSEIIDGNIFIADKPEGPFKMLGKIEVDYNGFLPGLARYHTNGRMANVGILLRPDGRYMLVGRSSAVMISDHGILGPYKIMSDRVYKDIPKIPQEKMEDPSVWYSGGMYHMVINHHPTNITYHFSSKDGIHDWKYRGIAFKQSADIFKYTDGTVNDWTVVQRMAVHVEDGHPAYFLFSVIDLKKGEDRPNDQHGSKIVLVPFDGKAFDKDMMALIKSEKQ